MKGRDMHLTDLQYFQAIARAGNLSHTARLLGVRQPTLTVALQRLETEFGTPLFFRDRSGVSLTPAGKALLQYVTDALALLEAGRQHVQTLESDEGGDFVLGVPVALGGYFLPSFLPEFFRTAPRIDISLWTGTSRAVQQAILSRDVPIGLVVNPVPHPDLVLLKLFYDATELFIAAAGPEAPDPTPWETAAARLRTGPLVYVAYMSQAQALCERLAAMQLLPMRQLRCGDLELAKNLALAGVGVAILPRRVANAAGRLQCLHPTLPFMSDVVYLAYRVDWHRTRAATCLKDALVAHGRRLGSDDDSQRIERAIKQSGRRE
jgi:DNA-binding transcriptional LysR family regulator